MADTTSTNGKSILEKLHAVMESIDRIKKDKKVAHQNYEYASEKAIKEALHTEFVKNKILFFISTSNPQFINGQFYIEVNYVFQDVENAKDQIRGTMIGSGHGRDEKGNYAAVTGAIKYILTSNFLIPTGDDPEKDDVPKEKPAKVTPPAVKPPASVAAPKSATPAPKVAPVPAPAKPLVPHVEGDISLSKEQSAQIIQLWKELMEFQNTPDEKRGVLLTETLTVKYGVKTIASLRSKQAVHMIDGLKKALGNALDKAESDAQKAA